MSLQSFSYFAFLPLVALIDLKLPAKWQNGFLALASGVFYALTLRSSTPPKIIITAALLLFVLCFVRRMGLAIARAADTAKKRLLRTGVITLLAVLAVFKYWNLSPLPTLFAGSVLERLPFPLGISFFTFAAIGYLVDVARGDAQAEASWPDLALFLFFFGTITSGPICRAGKLLPQLKTERRFEESRTVNALRLFAVGGFKKIAVADVLGLFVNEVFGNLGGYGGPALLLALLGYTLQLYFDFSGYSDMARASGLLLGIDLPVNFKTPFFATNFSGFWNRWHISLSGWLQDYLFMPLVWADTTRLTRGKMEHLPATWCVFTVFFVSGFWHGNTLPFVVWGLMQAAYRVGEELMHQKFGKPKKKGVKKSTLYGKRAAVFLLWMASMLPFRVGSGPDTSSLADCGAFLTGLSHGWNPALFASQVWQAVGNGFYAKPVMQGAWFLFVAIGLFIGFYLDAQQFGAFKGKNPEVVLAGQKPLVKWLLYYALVFCIFAGLILQNGGFGGGTSFAYAGF